MNRWIESEDGKKYCGPECREKDLPRCCICGKPVDQWITDDKGKIYCSETCFEENCPRCDACGKRMRTWRYTQTGIKFCDETCRSRIEKIMDWYERDNVPNAPFKSFDFSKADLHEQTKMLSVLAFLLLSTGVDEQCIEIIIRKVCTANAVRQQDFQYYMRKAYSTSVTELREGMALVTNDVFKYYYAQLLLLTGFCNGMEEHLKNISEVLSILKLTKYEIRFLCNRIVEHI